MVFGVDWIWLFIVLFNVSFINELSSDFLDMIFFKKDLFDFLNIVFYKGFVLFYNFNF